MTHLHGLVNGCGGSILGVGDVYGNGLPDLYTSNFMYDNNTLHANMGDMAFNDNTLALGLLGASRPLLGWASFFADFDNDGDPDLFCKSNYAIYLIL